MIAHVTVISLQWWDSRHSPGGIYRFYDLWGAIMQIPPTKSFEIHIESMEQRARASFDTIHDRVEKLKVFWVDGSVFSDNNILIGSQKRIDTRQRLAKYFEDLPIYLDYKKYYLEFWT